MNLNTFQLVVRKNVLGKLSYQLKTGSFSLSYELLNKSEDRLFHSIKFI